MLAHDIAGSGPRIVLLHGFTQTRRCWAPIDEALAADHEVVRVDLPGHGGSADVHADLWSGADLVADVGATAVYLGYSMGARHALHLAIAHPTLVEALVVIGPHAGIDDDRERAERRRRDEQLAAHIEAVGAAHFVDEWLAVPPYTRVHGDAGTFASERRANTTDGLAASLRLAGTGSQDPLWSDLGGVQTPTLVVVGAADEPFRPRAERLVAALGGPAELAVVPDAGHAAHLEQPAAFLEIVQRFLADLRR